MVQSWTPTGDAILLERPTDTSPSSYFLRGTNAAGSANLVLLDDRGDLALSGTLTVTGATSLASIAATSASFTSVTDTGVIVADGYYITGTHPLIYSAAPTVSGTGLGTSPSIVASSTAAMDIEVGTTPAAASFTITFGLVATNGWVCTGNDITTQSTTVAQLKQVGGTTTTALMENFSDVMAAHAMVASDHLRVSCIAY